MFSVFVFNKTFFMVRVYCSSFRTIFVALCFYNYKITAIFIQCEHYVFATATISSNAYRLLRKRKLKPLGSRSYFDAFSKIILHEFLKALTSEEVKIFM